MKAAQRQSRYGDEYPHVVRKHGRRDGWRSQIRIEVGPADATVDAKNSLNVYGGMIMGVKKTRFKPKQGGAGSDFGVIAMDTAAAAVG